MLKTEKVGWSDFIDFNGSQTRRRHSTSEFLLRPSDIWTEDSQKSRQLKGLKRRIIDLIDEKKEK
jgi:hypothetical protein